MSKRPGNPIAVLGAGSWGTALAIQLARSGQETILWGRDPKQLLQMKKDRVNARYLPEAPFPDLLEVTDDLITAVKDIEDVLVCVPSHALRETLEGLEFKLCSEGRVCWATKGFEMSTGKLPHQVVAEVLGDRIPGAVLSGPTFATEVGAGLPTAITVASEDKKFASELAARISSEQFRAYTETDMIGVEVGGAVKNVLAIGAGISDGLGFGANTRVALITRGLAEMSRLGVALGASRETFMGLAGIGDLVLTCTDNQSRNRRMGLALAAGASVEDAEAGIGQVVEGVLAAKAVRLVARREDVEMPLCEMIYQVIYEQLPPATAVKALMTRSLKAEN